MNFKTTIFFCIIFATASSFCQDNPDVISGVRLMGHGPAIPSIFVAARQGNASPINIALAHGAQVNAVDAQGNTPLYYAVENGSLPAVQALVEHGADVNQPAFGSFNASPVHMAARMADKKIVNYLVQNGAHLDI